MGKITYPASNMLLTLLREGLGRVFVFFDFLTRPKIIERSAKAQTIVNEKAKGLSLYQFYACPFCIKTRRVIRQLQLPIELRDAQKPGQHRNDLEKLGGRIKVPCLRIQTTEEDRWMYESDQIIDYLERNFSDDSGDKSGDTLNTG